MLYKDLKWENSTLILAHVLRDKDDMNVTVEALLRGSDFMFKMTKTKHSKNFQNLRRVWSFFAACQS